MKTEHTPGPWELDFSSDLSDAVVYKLDCGTIAVIPGDLTANVANSRLIKAAPDLLTALEVADRLLTQCLTVLNDKRLVDKLPFGLLDEVKRFVVENVGTDAVRAAKGEGL